MEQFLYPMEIPNNDIYTAHFALKILPESHLQLFLPLIGNLDQYHLNVFYEYRLNGSPQKHGLHYKWEQRVPK